MKIKTPKNIAEEINKMKDLGYTNVLLGERFAFCFNDSEFKRMMEFINVYDNVANMKDKEPLFPKFFYVAYDNNDEDSCWAVADEMTFATFLSDAKFEAVIVPAPGVRKAFENGWTFINDELVDYKDN